MLGKLLKYEFKATGRTFLPVLAAMLVMAGVSRVIAEVGGLKTPFVISTVLTSFLVGAILVLVFVIAIQRFRRNLLGDEGYLMFTLPVSADGLIFSKLIVAVVWMVVSVVAATFAILLLVDSSSAVLRAVFDELPNIFATAQNALVVVEVCVFVLLGAAAAVLTFYACTALAMLASRHRGLLSFGIFMGFGTVGQILSALGIVGINQFNLSNWAWLRSLDPYGAVQLVLGGLIVLVLAVGAVMYFITRTMLKRRLNLE